MTGTRKRVIAWLLAVPVLMTAMGLSAIEVWRLRNPADPLFATPFAYSLADAIAGNDIARAYTFIRGGQDPNKTIAVSHPVLTAGRTALVPPLLWAVAMRNRDAALMLLGFGAQVTDRGEQSAVCLARRLGDPEMERLLTMYGSGQADETCPLDTGKPLLVSE